MQGRLTALRWTEIEEIDDDLGRSTAGGVLRAGFERIVAEVCLGKVGVIRAREVSRFARNSRDWQQLIEMCRVDDTVLIDQETIYVPRHGNDRLLLGLKCSPNKYELDLLRQRLLSTRYEKTRRGELVVGAPVGFEKVGDRYEKDPDHRVQVSTAEVFDKVDTFKSIPGALTVRSPRLFSFRGGSMRQLLFLIIDVVVVAFATVLALFLRENFEFSMAQLRDIGPYLLCTLAAATVTFPAFQTSRPVWRFSMMTDYLRITFAIAATVIGALAIGFNFNRLDGVPRSLPLLQGLLTLFFLVGLRILARTWRNAAGELIRLGAKETPRAVPQERIRCETVLVVGLNELAALYLRAVAAIARERVLIAGVLTNDDGRHVGRAVLRHQILGTCEEVVDALRALEVHGVFVDRIVVTSAFDKLSRDAQDALLEIEKGTSVCVEFLVDQMGLGPRFASEAGEGAVAALRNSFTALSLSSEHLAALARRPYWRAKRPLDCFAALGLLIVVAPLMAFAAALVAIDLGLPLTFWQQRPGLFGRPFKLYKLRTMAPAHDASGRRLREDERSSCIGRFLRRTRLDELPQLLSILWGDMSFVGPRPLLPVDQPPEFAARLLVRPGLTGWAQVKGGRDISAVDKGALDVWYVHNASLALDIETLIRTALILIFGETIDAAAIREAWEYLHRAEADARKEPVVSEGDAAAFFSVVAE